jgi:hypothetical protein
MSCLPIGGIVGIGADGQLVLFNRSGKIAIFEQRIAGILERFGTVGSYHVVR